MINTHIINISMVFFLLLGKCEGICQNKLLDSIRLDNDVTLFVISLKEQFDKDTLGVSFYLGYDQLLQLNEMLNLDTAEEVSRCGGTHNVFLMSNDNFITGGNINLSCNQLQWNRKVYHFSDKQFNEIKSLGRPLSKSHYAFKDIIEARAFYKKIIQSDSTIVLKDELKPDWVLYDGVFAVSFLDDSNLSDEKFQDKILQKLRPYTVKMINYYSRSFEENETEHSFTFYTTFPTYNDLSKYGFSSVNYMGKFKHFRKLEINTFKKDE